MAILGSSTYSLDTKNRVFVPAKYREDLGNTFYVTRSVNSCLTIYTESEWSLFLERLDRIPNTAGAAAKIRQDPDLLYHEHPRPGEDFSGDRSGFSYR